MIELERTFLVKHVPAEVLKSPMKEIVDIYIPEQSGHPRLRLRRSGEVLEMTKKQPVEGTDSSRQEEQTIRLSEEEFAALAGVSGKKSRKFRYYWNSPSGPAEVDVFQDALRGLVLVDFEFENIEAKDSFRMPDFCLAEVTEELFAAGGMLVGKKYSDIEQELARFEYQKIIDRE